MKALVTGGTGFLGRHLAAALRQTGAEVTVLNTANADLRQPESLRPFQATRYDRIYHLAAWTKAGDFCLHHKGEQWIVNQQINTQVLAFWQQHQSQALMIAMGTSCAYPPEMELREENYLVGEPDRDLYTYAMTKRMLYVGLQSLAHQFGLRYRHLIPSTLFGPNFDLTDSHFIFDLIKKIVAGRRQDVPVVLWGNGYQVRELIFVRDAIRLIEWAAERDENILLNLGTGQGHTIREYARLICEQVGYDPERIQYDTTAFTGVAHKVLSPARLKTLCNFEFTELRQALAETIEYYLAQPQETLI